MMTGGKVILTYKRRKPPLWIAYKRRRISSRKIFCQGNGCSDKYNAPTIGEKQDSSTEGNDSEYRKDFQLVPEENGHLTGAIKHQDCLVSAEKACRKDKNQDLHDMMSLAAGSLAVLDGSPGEDILEKASADHCCLDLREQQKSNSIRESSCSYLVPEENGHLTGAIKQQDCLVSAEKASREEDKNQDLHNMMPLAAASLAFLDGSPGEDISRKASTGHCCLDLREQQKSNNSRESSCLYLVPEENGNLTGAIKQQDCLVSAEKASRGEDNNLDLHDMIPLAAVSLAVLDGSPREDISRKASADHCSLDLQEQPNSNSVRESSCSYLNSGSTSDNKSSERCSVPLIASCSITVERHDLSLNGNHNDCIVACASENETGLPVQDKSISMCNSATVQSKLNSPLITFCRKIKRMKDASKLQTQNVVLVDNDGSLPSDTAKEATLSKCSSEHDFIASRDVESSRAGSGLSPESGNVKQGDDKLENTSNGNPSPVEVVPQVTEENISSLDKNVDLRLPEDPVNCGNSSNDATVDKETEILPHDDLSSIRGTIEVPTSRGSVMSLDLSVPLPVDSDIRSVHGEQPHRASPDLRFGSHTTHLNDECPRNKGLELLHDRIGETDSFANSPPVATVRNSYLQLFPEVRNDGLLPSTKMHKKVRACANSEKRFPLGNSSQARTAAANSSLFLGLFLPMELINDGHDHSSTSAQWLNVGVQSKEYLQDTLSNGFPDHPSSFLRNKMVLDSIASRSRTRTANQNQSSCLNLYGYPTKWSEEELDSLWIGVRRYGRGNWNVMLRDTKLDFSPWRTPMDLAQQWEEEQLKLFNTRPFSQGMHLRTSNVFPDLKDGFWHPMMGRQSLMDDVQLSLGDAFSKPRDSVHKRPSFTFTDIQNNVAKHHEQPVSSTGTTYSYGGSHRSAMFPNNAMMDVECSFGASGSTCMPVGRNLPHWLKELVPIPQRPPQAAFPISSIGPAKLQCADKPCLNDRGFDHKPTNTISNKNTVPGVELQIGAGSLGSSLLPVAGHQKAEQDQHRGNKQDLIIIESDASSEETISDNRSAKV